MKDRIKQLMEAQHMNQQAFAACTGISSASLSSIFTGRTNPTLNHVDAIMAKFPNVNPMWLLRGVGGMMLVEGGEVNNSTSATGSVGGVSGSGPAMGGSQGDSAHVPGSEHVVQNDLFSSANVAESSSVSRPSGTSGPSHSGAGRGYGQQGGQRGDNSGRYATQGRQDVMGVQMLQSQREMRKITEIRVFYDDQTWESFVPKK